MCIIYIYAKFPGGSLFDQAQRFLFQNLLPCLLI